MNFFEHARNTIANSSIFNNIARDQINIDHVDHMHIVHNTTNNYHQYYWDTTDVAAKLEEALTGLALDARKVLGEDVPASLTTMINLAMAHWHQDRLKEAEDLMVQALELSKNVLEAAHPLILTIMGNLAEMYKSDGKLQEAKVLAKEIESTKKKILA